MTPAIDVLKKTGIEHTIHQFRHDPRSDSFGREAAERLGIPRERVFKTLLVAFGGNAKNLGVGVIPVESRLDLKAIAKACGAKRANMAEPTQAERVTGYLVGGISPLGQKRLLPTIIDANAQRFSTVFVSAGQRGLEIELAPRVLEELLNARFMCICRN